MHCELVVPALFASRDIPRLPAAELLVARGRATHQHAGSLEEWLAQAFSIETRPVPAGALSLHSAQTEEETDRGASRMRADPVHLRLGADGPTLLPAAGFEITRTEADRLAASLNEHFGAQASFVVLAPVQWCARTALESDFAGAAPADLAGQPVDSRLPQARGAAFLTEIQMVLHDHPVNRDREARGAPVVNSLWLWGSGKLPASVEAPWHSLTADEPLCGGLARLAGMRWRRLPASAAEWLERAPEEGRHLLVLDQLRGVLALGGAQAQAGLVRDLEAGWFAPLLDALRAGRIGMVTLHVPEAGANWETIRSDLRRFWRRARPLTAKHSTVSDMVRSGRIDPDG